MGARSVTMSGESPRDVFVLGAGFSRALSAFLPLTDELGNRCLARDSLADSTGLVPRSFAGGRFEAWLTRIAEPQPYLTEAADVENQSLFVRFSEAIHDVLTAACLEALEHPWPSWLPAFLRIAHASRATLITFNYDTLIECAVETHAIAPWPDAWVNAVSILGGVPAEPVLPGMRFAPTRVATFRLLKLHGSLNWYWVHNDGSGTSMATGPIPGFFGAPRPVAAELIREILPGRTPFIVPPASSKSAYFRNPIVRQIWSDAFSAISKADRVTFMGYSLPAEDNTLAGLLSTALTQNQTATLEVADLYPDPIVERLKRLGLTDRVSVASRGETAIDDVVTSRVDEYARLLPQRVIAALSNPINATTGANVRDCRLVVVFDRNQLSTVSAIRFEGGDIVLICDPAQDRSQQILESVGESNAVMMPTARDLVPYLEQARRMIAEVGSRSHRLYGMGVENTDTGSTGPWLAFLSATTPRTGATSL